MADRPVDHRIGYGIGRRRLWGRETAFDANTSRGFGVVVGIEVAIAVVGVVVLAILRMPYLSAPWVALVVGLHLFPVAALLHFPLLYAVAEGLTAVAIAAVPVARSQPATDARNIVRGCT